MSDESLSLKCCRHKPMSDVLTNNAELSGLLWSILVIASMVTRMYLVLEKESQTSTSASDLEFITSKMVNFLNMSVE